MGSMYGRGMYGGYGGYGGMGMMGGGNEQTESMFNMVQMLEMNNVWMQELQQHVMVTYNRLRDVVVWMFALKDVFLKRGDAAAPSAEGAAPQVEQYYFESDDAKAEALQRLKKRLKVLLV